MQPSNSEKPPVRSFSHEQQNWQHTVIHTEDHEPLSSRWPPRLTHVASPIRRYCSLAPRCQQNPKGTPPLASFTGTFEDLPPPSCRTTTIHRATSASNIVASVASISQFHSWPRALTHCLPWSVPSSTFHPRVVVLATTKPWPHLSK